MVSYMCPVSLWWGGERRDVEEVRTGEWNKRSGKESMMHQMLVYCSRENTSRSALVIRVAFVCSIMSLLSPSVSICQILVFQQKWDLLQKCNKPAGLQYAKFMLSLPAPTNEMTRKQGICCNKWKMVWTARSKHAMTALIWDRWNTHMNTLCSWWIRPMLYHSLQQGDHLRSSVGLGSHNLYAGSYGNVSNAKKFPMLKWQPHSWSGLLWSCLEAAYLQLPQLNPAADWAPSLLLSATDGSFPLLFAVLSYSSSSSLSQLGCQEAFPQSWENSCIDSSNSLEK